MYKCINKKHKKAIISKKLLINFLWFVYKKTNRNIGE